MNTTHSQDDSTAHSAPKRTHLSIACIGGGTGLFTILRALKSASCTHDNLELDLNAIVAMTDSGGSTGRLRDEFGYLPPGDVRQCLVALSEAPDELRELMQYRFHQRATHLHDAKFTVAPSSLHGHTVGNLLLTAFKDIAGGEYEAVEAMERLLRIKGKVYPVTLTNANLVAELEDGQRIIGETNIDVPKHNPELRITKLYIEPHAVLFHKTREALYNADIILIGPGDLYTSVLPNLIVSEMHETLAKARARGAKTIYITNTMTKYGETNNFKASDFVREIAKHAGYLNAIIANTGRPSSDLLEAYAKEHAALVDCDLTPETLQQRCGLAGTHIIARDLLTSRDFARHDGEKLAHAVCDAIQLLRSEK